VPRAPHDGTAADAARHAMLCRRCFVGTPLLPIPPPFPLPPSSGGWVPRTPHDGTPADAAHAITSPAAPHDTTHREIVFSMPRRSPARLGMMVACASVSG
jgi:hypothetical protein